MMKESILSAPCFHDEEAAYKFVEARLWLTPKAAPSGIWQAKIKPEGARPKHKTFSVSRLGYWEAFRRAVKARMQMLQALEDRPYIKHPTAKWLARRNGLPASHERRQP